MRTLISVTLCTFLLMGGCSKSDDENQTSGMTSDTIDTAKTEGSEAVDANSQIATDVVEPTQMTEEAVKTAGDEMIDQASDMAAVEAEKAQNDAVEAATDSASKAMEDASGTLNK